MKTAFLFPGQGSQYVGMAADLTSIDAARRILEAADLILGFPLTERMFGTGNAEADEERLRQTDVTQPALFVHSMAVSAVLVERGVHPDVAAGHSLGEYSALTAAGALSFEDGLRTVRLRGELMAEAGTRRPGAMAAVLGADDHIVEAICAAASTAIEVVQPANYNAPGQVVISGDGPAVARAMAIAPDHGVKKVVQLPVSGAFHSPLMEFARAGLGEALDRLPVKTPSCPVYLNVSAEPTTDPDQIRRALLDQLTAPVRWSQSLANMQRDGVIRYVEVGAGKVLAGLAKRTLGRDVETLTIGSADDLELVGTGS
ncbi:MAG TPA: ACP S-malonyltransferase [Rhodothermia bacterium]|nr:ACP S-malonyltransferase [Rhodothermia bacterium]